MAGATMGLYKRVLCAVDLTDDSRAVALKAAALAQSWQAELRLLHVVELVPIEPMSDSLVPVVQIDDRALERAREQLQALANLAGIAATAASVVSGSVKAELLRQAREWQADLIVLGSRERHGLSILVNLTEDTVLHGACCDVLAMRVR
jgi:universal stress protein A